MLNNQMTIKINLGEENRVDISITALLGEKMLAVHAENFPPNFAVRPKFGRNNCQGKIIPKVMLHHYKKGKDSQLLEKINARLFVSLFNTFICLDANPSKFVPCNNFFISSGPLFIGRLELAVVVLSVAAVSFCLWNSCYALDCRSMIFNRCRPFI
jgi:hypothetical protein